MNYTKTSDLREQTARYWAGFVHARGDVDVTRVHAFQALMLAKENNLSNLSDEEVTLAYGGPGWAPAPVCVECGIREDTNVIFGALNMFSLCSGCIQTANTMVTSPVQKRSLFSFLKGN